MLMDNSFAIAIIDYASNCTEIRMRSQVLSEQSVGVRAFAALLRAHASLTRQLNAQLVAEHGLTINDYEVLFRLARAPDRRLRRVDLAEEIVLTASGITRLLDGLEQAGYVERASCATDRRVVYAVLTDAGLRKLREASRSHLAQIDELVAARLDAGEQERLADLLRQLGGGDAAGSCDPAA
jgi:DNA-binding MarR family transcriptional regulator